jgi:hypothetical protein
MLYIFVNYLLNQVIAYTSLIHRLYIAYIRLRRLEDFFLEDFFLEDFFFLVDFVLIFLVYFLIIVFNKDKVFLFARIHSSEPEPETANLLTS